MFRLDSQKAKKLLYNHSFFSQKITKVATMSIYKMLSPYLFKLDSETAHSIASFGLKSIAPLPLIQDFLTRRYCVVDNALKQNIAGLNFYNPIGLSAGFDKNATLIKGLSTLGFGFLELGTVTQSAQSGNPKPRIFRFQEQKSLQNSMGFNNKGSAEVSKQLAKNYPYTIPLGVNLGKNKVIEQKDSLKNYENTLLDFLNLGDYYTFNLSSPNTPNLRDLQNVSFVKELFSMARSHTAKPLFLKISPDMELDSMLKVVEMAIEQGANGIIATNTTIDYSLLEGAKDSGGISGEALKEKSKEILRQLSKAFFGKTILISTGGISTAQEVYERIKLGANLVQIYTALIYEGPSICANINKDLLKILQADGFSSITQAIGIEAKSKATKSTKSSIKNTESKILESKKADSNKSQNTESKKSKIDKKDKEESTKKPTQKRNTRQTSKTKKIDAKSQQES